MVEKMVLVRDKKKKFWGHINCLSKVFDCISHDLLTAKLNANGFDRNAHIAIHDYLS